MIDVYTLQAQLDVAHERIRQLTAELESLHSATHARCYHCSSRPHCSYRGCRPPTASCGTAKSYADLSGTYAASIGYPR